MKLIHARYVVTLILGVILLTSGYFTKQNFEKSADVRILGQKIEKAENRTAEIESVLQSTSPEWRELQKLEPELQQLQREVNKRFGPIILLLDFGLISLVISLGFFCVYLIDRKRDRATENTATSSSLA